jgi:hypothetical protein
MIAEKLAQKTSTILANPLEDENIEFGKIWTASGSSW